MSKKSAIKNLFMLINQAYLNKYLFIKIKKSLYIYKILKFLKFFKFIWLFFYSKNMFYIFFRWTCFKSLTKFKLCIGRTKYYHKVKQLKNSAIYETALGLQSANKMKIGGHLVGIYG